MTLTHTEAPSTYPPPQDFAEDANATTDLYRERRKTGWRFWAKQADRLTWETPFDECSTGRRRPSRMVPRRKTQCHLQLPRPPRPGRTRRPGRHPLRRRTRRHPRLTYTELLTEVSRAANYLTELGLVAGDRVAIYMPMIPEAIIAILACARLGTPLRRLRRLLPHRTTPTRRRRASPTDHHHRRTMATRHPRPLKNAVDQALTRTQDPVEHVLVVRRTGIEVPWTQGRDLWWHDTVANASPAHEARPFDAEHPLFILYTSGTTGNQRHPAHQRRLPHPNLLHPPHRLRPQTGHRHLLVHRRHRLDHRTLLHRLRTPVQPRHTGLYEGTPNFPERAPPLPDHRKIRRHPLLHRAHPHPHLHEMGTRDPRRPRPVQPAPARLGRRTHQPRSLALVPRRHRRHRPHRRHLVADRNRRHHDLPPARNHHPKPGAAMTPLPGISAKVVDEEGNRSDTAKSRAQRLPRPGPTLALHAPRHLGRHGPLPRNLLGPLHHHGWSSPATAPSTPTATCGSSAASTTS